MKNFKDKAVIILLGGFMLGMLILSILIPDMEYSVSERKKLQTFPTVSVRNILSGKFMSEYEEYTADQFPFRDMFRKIKASAEMKFLGRKDNNGLYEYDGYIAKTEYPLDEESIAKAAEKFTFLYDKFLKESEGRVYLSVVPDKNFFLADISGHLKIDYEELTSSLRKKMPYAEYIDIFPLLELSDYYLTDTHWKQESLIDVSQALINGMGGEIPDEYLVTTVDDVPFYGVYASQYALNEESDKISYLTNDIIDSFIVYDYENGKNIPVYDEGKITSDDPYELFVGGPVSLITIENPSVKNGKELIVFRDSFGSSLAPLISQAYEKTTLIDIRYISPNILSNFVEFDGQDVLFIYSSMVINNSETLK